MKYFWTTYLLLAFLGITTGQERIKTLDGKEVIATIIEINDSTIVYKLVNDPYDILYTIPKSKLHSINFDGYHDNRKLSYEEWAGTPKRAIRLGIYSLIHNSINFSYEQVINTSINWEISANIYSKINDDAISNMSGLGLGVAIKYFPLNRSKSIHTSSPTASLLNGWYLKGGLYYDQFEEDQFFQIRNQDAILASLQSGYSYTVAKRLNLEVFFGIATSLGKARLTSPNTGLELETDNFFTHGIFISESPIVFTYDLRLGYAF